MFAHPPVRVNTKFNNKVLTSNSYKVMKKVPKILSIMRISAFLLFLCVFTSFAEVTYSQNAKVNINEAHMTISEFIEQIESQTDYLFVYSKNELNTNDEITVQPGNKTVAQCLSEVFSNTSVKFVFENDYIVLTTKNEISGVLQQNKRQITGIVTDEWGEPIIGANILEKGTINGVVTDINGNFLIAVSQNAILQVTYIGYVPQEYTLGSSNSVTIHLKEDTQTLDEVVVVAYGTQKKVNLTGAVSNIKGDNLENRTASNVTNILTGQVAGISVVQNSGQPGADTGALRVRGIGTLGNSEAMVVVDGVESNMASVNPNDIEDISVLKDAAASAIYGVRAANGVVLITTKKGSIGKPVISYNGYVGWQSASRLPKYLGSADYATLLNEAYVNDGLNKPYSDQDIEKYRNGSDPDHYPNSDWAGALVSENGLFHNHYVSMIGGSENIKYAISLGYHDKDGLVPNTSYNKYTVRANLDAKVNSRLNVKMNLSAYRDKRTEPAVSLATLFAYNFREAPTSAIQFSNGNYGLYLNEHNSVSQARDGGVKNLYNNNFLGNIGASYSILKGLTWHGSASATFNLKDQYSFQKSIKYYTADSAEPTKTSRSKAFNQDDKMLEVNLQTYLDYDQTFGVHGIKGLIGYSQIQNQNRLLYASRDDMPSNNSLGEINAGDVTTQTTQGNKVEYALRSVFGRINYNYDNRYLLEANIRYDGTSRFPEDKRFGTFPSFSAGWRISEEKFFKVSFVDNLKVRGSWGILGNQEIGDYAYHNTYAFGKNYTFGNLLIPGISINDKMSNAYITWEKTDQIDVGFDADLLNGKLGLTFDYFRKNTDDILLQLPIPELVGVNPPTQNAGSVKNTGVEFIVRHNNKVKDFRYFATANFTYVNNEITDLKGTDYPGRSVGDPIYNIYGYVYDKIFDSQEEIDASPKQLWGAVPGDLKYKDLNGDNVVNEKDRKSIGTYFPKFNFGLHLGFEYKNIDFSTLLQGAADVDVIVRNEINKAFFNGGKVTEKHLDRWTPENKNASYPRLSLRNSTKNEHTSTFWMQDASYVKMRNLQVGYTIPKTILSSTGLSRLRLYFSADNLFTITGFEGVDPEAAGDITGNGNSYYPIAKSYSFGINASF